MAAARRNPVGDILQWHVEKGKLGIICVEWVDVDDARGGVTHGYRLRLSPSLKGVFEFAPCKFRRVGHRWVAVKPAKGTRTQKVTGNMDFKAGDFEPWKAHKGRLTAHAIKHMKRMFAWVRGELIEHKKFPPPRTGRVRSRAKIYKRAAKGKAKKGRAKPAAKGRKPTAKRGRKPTRKPAAKGRGGRKGAPVRRNPSRGGVKLCCLESI